MPFGSSIKSPIFRSATTAARRQEAARTKEKLVKQTGEWVPSSSGWLCRLLVVCRVVVPVFACIVVRLVVVYGSGYPGFFSFSSWFISSFMTATVTASALLLNAVLQDFKDAVKIPSDLGGHIGFIQTLCLSLVRRGEITPTQGLTMLRSLDRLLRAILRSIEGDFVPAMRDFTTAEVELMDFEHHSEDLPHALMYIRVRTTRTRVIQSTDFLSSGLSLIDVCVGPMIFLLTFGYVSGEQGLSVNGNVQSSCFAIAGFGMVLMFIRSIVIDMESPFDCPDGHLTRNLDAAVAGLPERLISLREVLALGGAHITCDVLSRDIGPELAANITKLEDLLGEKGASAPTSPASFPVVPHE